MTQQLSPVTHAELGLMHRLAQRNQEVLKDWLDLSDEKINHLTEADVMISGSRNTEEST
jgi:hypothetical protein